MPKRRENRTLIMTLLVLDAACIAGALSLAYLLRSQGGVWQSSVELYQYEDYLWAGAMTLPFWLITCAICRLYDPAHLLGGVEEYSAIARANTFGIALLVIVSFLQHTSHTLARGWVAMTWLFSILLMGVARFAFRRLIYRLRRRGRYGVENALIAGVSDQAESLAAQLSRDGSSGLRVVGFLDDYLPIGTPIGGGLIVLGAPSALERIVRELDVTQVIVLPNALTWESFQQIISHAGSRANGYEVQLVPSVYELLTTGVCISHRTSVPLLGLNRARLTGLDALIKAGLDYGLGSLMLIASLPLLLAIALALRLGSNGPLLTQTTVLGLQYRRFDMFKFRTDRAGGSRVERWLQRSHLEKLPQLFNVLAGHVSLVGPRPIAVGMDHHYATWLPSLLCVKPGVTGPWAVNRSVNASLEEEMYQSIYYIRQWTVWLDLQILFQSLMQRLQLRGAHLPWVAPRVSPLVCPPAEWEPTTALTCQEASLEER